MMSMCCFNAARFFVYTLVGIGLIWIEREFIEYLIINSDKFLYIGINYLGSIIIIIYSIYFAN